MKNQKKLYIIVTIIILGILGVVGFSYAYFSGILGTGNDITISSARLGLIYEDGTSEITADTSKPGSIYEKTFKATNESDTVIKYNIEWIDVENTFVVKEELVYRIENLDGTVVVEETVTPSEDGLIIGGITINPSEVHEYKLIIEFKNLENNSLDNMGKVFNGKIEINTDSYSTEFAYTGTPQTFTVPEDGYYEVELWGAAGGGNNPGSYTSGKIYLTKDENIYVYVGQSGTDANVSEVGGYNGGGSTDSTTSGKNGATGGGSTDIRITSDIRSRIMVAGASGGGATGTSFGGGLVGANGIRVPIEHTEWIGKGGTQTSGGPAPTMYSTATSNGRVGGFGYGGTGGSSANTANTGGGSGGGSGYYGGSGASGLQNGTWPGGSGSSYISGYGGVNSVIETGGTVAQPLHTNNTIHYSGKYFIDPVMLTGAEELLSIEGNEIVGNEGNGKAKITYLGKPTPKKITTDLDNVRYIKDCINGNTFNVGNHWVELQAVINGVNVAQGKSIIGSVGENSARPYSKITDGDIILTNYATSIVHELQCVTVDLGQEYDLDEVTTWHYYDGRSYNNHTLSVGATNVSGTTPLSTVLINNRSEVGTSSQGFKVSAYESEIRKYYDITTETIEGQSVLTPTSQSAGDKVALVSQFTDSSLYGGVLIRNADTNEQYLTIPKTDIYFIMPAFNIKVTPIINKTFNITKGSATGGSVAIATTGLSGSTVSFTTSQSTGYYYNGATVTYSGGNINLTSAQKSFTMPSGNVTITPKFAKYNYTVSRTTVTGGSITSVNTATYGQEVCFYFNPSTGRYYSGANVYNTSTGTVYTSLAQTSACFVMPAHSVTIIPRFSLINYQLHGANFDHYGYATVNVSYATYGQTVTFNAAVGVIPGTVITGFTVHDINDYGRIIYNLPASARSFVMPAKNIRLCPTIYVNNSLYTQRCGVY